ncbi:hypothetical protein K504DRAFT_461297 [Pleomassaria siparia CBS 279.74]|uniref:Zn(2)-C6 fungal-type domain-containing protein n=1 Tax=Pleomassaria siparia CBS 279.74 TaxID=1314801 RepID=A0A6G1JV99_9PLEO|nr:hypothetical protein K504DRAFT_461297 [Pleomassaria siparia CBS 279.74]
MATRKTHNKTRLGCGQCKKRRIKCDGLYPVCQNCRRRDLECSFLLLAPASKLSAFTSTSTSTPTSATSTTITTTPKTAASYEIQVFRTSQSPRSSKSTSNQSESSASSSSPKSTPTFSINELISIPRTLLFDDVWQSSREHLSPGLQSVLHHYQYSSSLTLATDDPGKTAWLLYVPELASRHKYVVHCVLSVAALHLNRLYESGEEKKAMMAVAAAQMNKSLAGFRTALDNVTPDNASALFVCATLTAVYFFRTSALEIEETKQSIPYGIRVPSPEIVDKLMKSIMKTFWGIRGALAVLIPGWQWVTQGKMSPVCSRRWWPKKTTPASSQAMDEDAALCRIESLWIRPGQDYEPHFDHLSKALRHLRDTFALVSQLTVPKSEYPAVTAIPYSYDDTTVGTLKDRGAVFVWVARISREFMTLVEQRNREALIIVAHYAVLSGRVRNVWWLEGLGANMITAVAMALGREHWHLIQWPAQVIGVDLENAFGWQPRKDDLLGRPDEMHMQVI